jgi:hypothetical protein
MKPFPPGESEVKIRCRMVHLKSIRINRAEPTEGVTTTKGQKTQDMVLWQQQQPNNTWRQD